MIHQVAQTTDTAIILTTHDLAEAESLATRIAILNHGKIIVDDTPTRLKARLTSHAVISYHWQGHDHRIEVLIGDVEQTVKGLFRERPGLSQLEVIRPSLESAYLNLISGQGPKAAVDYRGPTPIGRTTP